MFSKFRFIFVALLTLTLASFAFAQGTTGEINGTVTDSTGAVIPGASVRVESTGSTTGFSRTVAVDSNGYFILSNLQPGLYKVSVTSSGFDTYEKTVRVVVDKASPVNAKLVPAGTTAEVDVDTSGAVTIDTRDTKIDTNITKDIIEALPKGTTYGSLLKIAPNVRPEPLGAGFQIDGASGAENVFVVDGQEVTNFRTGQLNSNNNLPFELLQEVQIKSTGFEAEYGGATGGVINAVTVGGNNDWHGNFGISFRPNKWQGAPTPALNRYGTGAGQFDYFNPPKDGGTDWFPVASLSGPIVKDRLWGSISYAPQIIETTRTIDFFDTNDPGRTVVDTQTYDSRVKTEQLFGRIDAQPTDNLRMFGTFLWNPIIQDGSLPGNTAGLTGTGLTVSDYAARGGRQNSNSVNGQVTWTPLNWVVLNFRGGRSFLNEKLNSYGLVPQTRYLCSISGSPEDVPGSGCSAGFNTGSNFTIDYDVSTRTTFDGDASFVGVNAGGRHNIKVGYQYNRLANNVQEGYKSTGYVVLYYGIPISSLLGFPTTYADQCDYSGGGPTTDCWIGSGLLQRYGTVGSASSDNTAIYGQDSWQIADRLTINFGLRLEREVVPSFGAPQTTSNIVFGWGDKPAPRFGVAYDLAGDGKTKIFGSYGWFYDRFKYELPRGSFGGDFYRRDYFEILPERGVNYLDYTPGNILGGAPDPVGGTCPIVNGPGYSVCQFDFRIATNSTTADIFSTGAVDPNLKAARQSEWTIGVERELGNNFLLAGRYTHKQIDRAVEDVGVFNDQGSEAYIIGNPGLGLVCEISTSANQPCTKAERKYDAVEIRIDKRATNYFFNASYTWSRLFGNYSGLASSDEFGRSSPNVNRFFDLPMLGYNANGVPDNGKLATDRPHVFKAYGGYSFDWADNGVNTTQVSAFTTFESGSPITTIYSLYNVSTSILYGRGDLGRTGMYSDTDLSINHRYKFGSDNNYTFEPFVEIINLFDENNEIARQTTISSTNFTASTLAAYGCTTCVNEAGVFDTIFNQGGIQQYVVNYLNDQGVGSSGRRNDYNQSNTFQGGRSIRFGFRFYF